MFFQNTIIYLQLVESYKLRTRLPQQRNAALPCSCILKVATRACSFHCFCSCIFPAIDEIVSLQSEILLSTTMNVYDDGAEHLLKERQEMLLQILAAAKPLNGNGFFNVDRPMIMSIISAAITYIIIMVQFNMSEKLPSCSPCLTLNQTTL